MNILLGCLNIFLFTGCFFKASIAGLEEKQSVRTSLNECIEDSPTANECQVSEAGKIVTLKKGSLVSSWNNASASDTLSAIIPDAYYSQQMCSFQDTDLISSNIKSGVNLFGVTGTYNGNVSFQWVMASNALRDAGSTVISNLTDQTTSNQISLDSEQNTYAGTNLPNTGGYNYRDIPDISKDDDGYFGTTCNYARRPTTDCGTVQNTLSARIADCATANPTTSSWDGATQCNRGQGLWKLVTKNGANKEVWQDQRTGQLWSSVMPSIANWCQASGSTQTSPLTFINSYNNSQGTPIIGNGTITIVSSGPNSPSETITVTFTSATTFTVSGTTGAGGCQGGSNSGGLTVSQGSMTTWNRTNYCQFNITQGSINFAVNDKFILNSVDNGTYNCAPSATSGLQPAAPLSYCVETASVNAPAGENWTTGVYFTAKGGMGKTATTQSPSVRWRLPSIEDYKIADVNGIRFVMPDMGLQGVSRPLPDSSNGSYGNEWTSTLSSSDRRNAYTFNSPNGSILSTIGRFSNQIVRCVGR